MRPAHHLVLLTLVTLITTLQLTVFASEAEQPESVAPGKFIPTFAVKYGGTPGWPPREEAARFDLLDVSASVGHSRVFTSEHGNIWQTLKHLNPHISIFLYQNGPCMYNTAAWGKLGEGWECIKAQHGIGSADRWAALGVKHGGYLQHQPYPNERLMNVGNSLSGATPGSTGWTNSIPNTCTWADRWASRAAPRESVVMSSCANSTTAGPR